MKKLLTSIAAVFMALVMCNAAYAKNAGLTIKQFSEQANINLSKSDSDYRMPTELEISNGEVNNTAQYMFSDTLGVTFTLDKKRITSKAYSHLLVYQKMAIKRLET